MLNFGESRHPVFRASSTLERGELKSKGKGKTSIHFNGSEETIEVIVRMIISFNQVSIYGAVADLRKELARDSSSAGKPAANENFESMVIPTVFPIANLFLRLMRKHNESCCVNTSRNSNNFLNNRNCSNCAPTPV